MCMIEGERMRVRACVCVGAMWVIRVHLETCAVLFYVTSFTYSSFLCSEFEVFSLLSDKLKILVSFIVLLSIVAV